MAINTKLSFITAKVINTVRDVALENLFSASISQLVDPRGKLPSNHSRCQRHLKDSENHVVSAVKL
jgi:hypothetical protein